MTDTTIAPAPDPESKPRPYWLPDTRGVLAITLIVALVVMSFVLIAKDKAIDNPALNMLLGGFMTVGFATIINYYFGSSDGSAKKDDTISHIAKQT
jgi:hypothetical protein